MRNCGLGWRWLLVVMRLGVAVGADVKVAADAPQVEVSVVRRVDVPYHLVTAGRPLEFDASGPAWLRVYTRLWWPKDGPDEQRYRLSLWQGDAERQVESRARRSRSSFGPGGRALGQWRSFFIQVPAGDNHYRLVLGEAGAETVAVRLTRQAPRPWQAVALTGARALTMVEGNDTVRYRKLVKGEPLRFAVEGPCRVRVPARLNFDPSMSGAQSFVLTVNEGRNEVARAGFRAARAPAGSYIEDPATLPSSGRTMRFSVPAGSHELRISLGGTLAKSAAVRIEILAGEKYE